MDDDNNNKYLLAYIRKIQNINNVKTLVIDEMVLLIKATVNRKRLDISGRKVSYIMGQYNINSHLYKKAHN